VVLAMSVNTVGARSRGFDPNRCRVEGRRRYAPDVRPRSAFDSGTCAELSNRLLLSENADADEVVLVETLDVAGFVLD
jgi:hypothetical protein